MKASLVITDNRLLKRIANLDKKFNYNNLSKLILINQYTGLEVVKWEYLLYFQKERKKVEYNTLDVR